MREILSTLINPVPVLYFLLILGLVFRSLKRKRTGGLCFGIAAVWLLIITTPFIPVALARSLEDRYPPVTDAVIEGIKAPCNIIVLGGGHSDDKDLSPNNQLSTQALSRLSEGLRIHGMIPGSKVVLSGYKGRSELPQALVLYRTALILGADSSSLLMQTAPENTRMEAESYAANHAKEPLILVTSAVHMPRAMMLFRKMGVNAIPAPADFMMKDGSKKHPFRFIPSSSYIIMMRSAIHEYVGILWEWLGGK